TRYNTAPSGNDNPRLGTSFTEHFRFQRPKSRVSETRENFKNGHPCPLLNDSVRIDVTPTKLSRKSLRHFRFARPARSNQHNPIGEALRAHPTTLRPVAGPSRSLQAPIHRTFPEQPGSNLTARST